ncbi:MAG: CoA transferase [Deltaproteobacteria bacterium]|nr:CoA transferase [Deltaproteobacteria bacterium]
MDLPLAGVRVLDLTHVLTGPYCTQILGDLGAEVIKIERPGMGDQTRRMPPYFVNEQSAYFLSLNRNKKSLTLDLKSPDGKEIFLSLVKISDVVINNFRVGTMEKLGFGYDELSKINPRLIWAAISGYGQTGPYRDRPSYDIIIQAMGGVMSYTGEPDGPPVRCGTPIGDLGGSAFAVIGILSALYQRSITQKGQVVDISLLDVQIALHTYRGKYYFVAGEVAKPVGTAHVSSVPLRAYRTKDSWVVIEAFMEHFWQALCKAMGIEQVAYDERYNSRAKRLEHREEVDRILEEKFLTKTTDEWMELFLQYEIPSGPINTLDKAFSDPHVLSRDMIVEIDHPVAGKLKDLGNPVKLPGAGATVYNPPPLLGQHNEEILRDLLGYGPEKIDELRKSNVI